MKKRIYLFICVFIASLTFWGCGGPGPKPEEKTVFEKTETGHTYVSVKWNNPSEGYESNRIRYSAEGIEEQKCFVSSSGEDTVYDLIPNTDYTFILDVKKNGEWEENVASLKASTLDLEAELSLTDDGEAVNIFVDFVHKKPRYSNYYEFTFYRAKAKDGEYIRQGYVTRYDDEKISYTDNFELENDTTYWYKVVVDRKLRSESIYTTIFETEPVSVYYNTGLPKKITIESAKTGYATATISWRPDAAAAKYIVKTFDDDKKDAVPTSTVETTDTTYRFCLTEPKLFYYSVTGVAEDGTEGPENYKKRFFSSDFLSTSGRLSVKTDSITSDSAKFSFVSPIKDSFAYTEGIPKFILTYRGEIIDSATADEDGNVELKLTGLKPGTKYYPIIYHIECVVEYEDNDGNTIKYNTGDFSATNYVSDFTTNGYPAPTEIDLLERDLDNVKISYKGITPLEKSERLIAYEYIVTDKADGKSVKNVTTSYVPLQDITALKETQSYIDGLLPNKEYDIKFRTLLQDDIASSKRFVGDWSEPYSFCTATVTLPEYTVTEEGTGSKHTLNISYEPCPEDTDGDFAYGFEYKISDAYELHSTKTTDKETKEFAVEVNAGNTYYTRMKFTKGTYTGYTEFQEFKATAKADSIVDTEDCVAIRYDADAGDGFANKIFDIADDTISWINIENKQIGSIRTTKDVLSIGFIDMWNPDPEASILDKLAGSMKKSYVISMSMEEDFAEVTSKPRVMPLDYISMAMLSIGEAALDRNLFAQLDSFDILDPEGNVIAKIFRTDLKMASFSYNGSIRVNFTSNGLEILEDWIFNNQVYIKVNQNSSVTNTMNYIGFTYWYF